MADQKISQLTTLDQSDIAGANDLLAIVDFDLLITKKATPNAVVLNVLTASSAAAKSALGGFPTGTIVGTTDTQTLSAKTLTDPAIEGAIKEEVFTITDGAEFEIDPGNGSIQLITLGANRTPKATNFAAGESVMLMVDDGTA
jgi:outer membrane lipoprotein SlyB